MRRKSCIDQTNSFFRLFVFCSFAPSPHEYTVSRGVPNPKNGENLIYYTPLKSQNFDGFLMFLSGF